MCGLTEHVGKIYHFRVGHIHQVAIEFTISAHYMQWLYTVRWSKSILANLASYKERKDLEG